jgi:hypothetical protein
MVLGAAMMSRTPGGGGSTIVIGLLMMVGIPIFYAVLGFIVGAIIALVYNVVAGFVGGLEIEVESNETPAYSAPPPPPQQWGQNQYQSGQGY